MVLLTPLWCWCVCVCSCVFVWRLDSQMTSTMRKKHGLKLKVVPETCSSSKKPNIRCVRLCRMRTTWWSLRNNLSLFLWFLKRFNHYCFRRETFITVPSSQLHQVEEEEAADIRTPTRLDCAHSEEDQAQVIGTVMPLTSWSQSDPVDHMNT